MFCCLCDCFWLWVKIGLLGLLLILVIFKTYMKIMTGMYYGNERIDGKTVIITGANAGIGKETARDLARRGARVILACRDMKKADKARDEIINWTGNKEVICKKLDLSSLASVREFAKDINATEPRLDILINNAGAVGLPNEQTQDGLNLAMQTNHLGPFLLTNLLVDLVKKSSPSRIIFVSSVAHMVAKIDIGNFNFTKNFSHIDVYSYSKLANVINANVLAKQLEGTGVTVNSLNPGLVNTEIGHNFWSKWIGLLPLLTFLTWCLYKTCLEGAQTTIYLAVADEVRGVTGKYFEDCKEGTMSSQAKDERLAKIVWEKSEELVSMKQK